MIKENIELLNKIKVVVGKTYNKGASDLLASNMSIKCEMDGAYEIMALFEDYLNTLSKPSVPINRKEIR